MADLFLACNNAASQQYKDLASCALRLGYSVVAANTTATTPLKPRDANKFEPLAALSNGSTAPFDVVSALSASAGAKLTKRKAALKGKGKKKGAGAASSAASGAAAASSGKRKWPSSHDDDNDDSNDDEQEDERRDTKGKTGGPSSSSPSSASASSPSLVQLSRLTVVAESVRCLSDLYPANPLLRGYDLVAVAPGEADVLKHVVANGCCDIVRLDLSAGKLPFPLKADLVAAVLLAGMVFEVDYCPAIRDPTLRRFFISNAAELLRLTRGNGVLLTSGASTALELRSPADAAAILKLAGFTQQHCDYAQTKAAALAVQHAEKRLSSGGAAGGIGMAAVNAKARPMQNLHGNRAEERAAAGGALVHVLSSGSGTSLPAAVSIVAAAASLPSTSHPPAAKRRKMETNEESADGSDDEKGAGRDTGSSIRLTATRGADDDGNLMLGLSSKRGDDSGDDDDEGDRQQKKKKKAEGGKHKNKHGGGGKQERRQQLALSSLPSQKAVQQKLQGGSGTSSASPLAASWLSTAGGRGILPLNSAAIGGGGSKLGIPAKLLAPRR